MHANNVTITNIVVDQTGGKITFDLKWDNSWYVTGPGTPNNWDAVWVFAKFRACAATLTDTFTHVLWSTTYSDHTFPATLEAMQKDTDIVGIDADGLGVMLRNKTVGIYPTGTNATVTLKATNLPATGDLDVRVYGIEMVYIPRGPLHLVMEQQIMMLQNVNLL